MKLFLNNFQSTLMIYIVLFKGNKITLKRAIDTCHMDLMIDLIFKRIN